MLEPTIESQPCGEWRIAKAWGYGVYTPHLSHAALVSVFLSEGAKDGKIVVTAHAFLYAQFDDIAHDVIAFGGLVNFCGGHRPVLVRVSNGYSHSLVLI